MYECHIRTCLTVATKLQFGDWKTVTARWTGHITKTEGNLHFKCISFRLLKQFCKKWDCLNDIWFLYCFGQGFLKLNYIRIVCVFFEKVTVGWSFEPTTCTALEIVSKQNVQYFCFCFWLKQSLKIREVLLKILI